MFHLGHFLTSSSLSHLRLGVLFVLDLVTGSRPGNEDHPKTVRDGNPGSLVLYQVLGQRYGFHVHHLLTSRVR
ncbi:hypothetical protein HZ326_10011 [Fusarium oxysporum f. sp. albedinis]|nr:hypothetical protein HZ326_10011 [Fusarium oxysporum f. sp. albedinis]